MLWDWHGWWLRIQIRITFYLFLFFHLYFVCNHQITMPILIIKCSTDYCVQTDRRAGLKIRDNCLFSMFSFYCSFNDNLIQLYLQLPIFNFCLFVFASSDIWNEYARCDNHRLVFACLIIIISPLQYNDRLACHEQLFSRFNKYIGPIYASHAEYNKNIYKKIYTYSNFTDLF